MASSESSFLLMNVGALGVGKSTLTIRLVCGLFVEKYDPTVEDTYRRPEEVNGVREILDILDTAWEENRLRELYYQKADGFLLIYSITDRLSFKKIHNIYERITQLRQFRVPMVLVGNKADLKDHREVSLEEGQQLADFLHIPFFETSAKTPQNVTEIFVAVAKEIQKTKRAAGVHKS